jgi:hypothetical protein
MRSYGCSHSFPLQQTKRKSDSRYQLDDPFKFKVLESMLLTPMIDW